MANKTYSELIESKERAIKNIKDALKCIRFVENFWGKDDSCLELIGQYLKNALNELEG